MLAAEASDRGKVTAAWELAGARHTHPHAARIGVPEPLPTGTVGVVRVTYKSGHDSVTLWAVAPGPPDAPRLWVASTTEDAVTIQWTPPHSYGAAIVGYRVFVAGVQVCF